MALDKIFETFVIYVSTVKILPKLSEMIIHPLWAAQIAAFQLDKAPTEISLGYKNYADVFCPDLTMERPKNIGINEHALKLIESKQTPYRTIYAISPVELEILKIYIKTHLKTEFIWTSKSSASTSIFFDKKPDGNFCLCINYQGFNNLIIKNWYPLPLIGELLDCLGRARRFM